MPQKVSSRTEAAMNMVACRTTMPVDKIHRFKHFYIKEHELKVK